MIAWWHASPTGGDGEADGGGMTSGGAGGKGGVARMSQKQP